MPYPKGQKGTFLGKKHTQETKEKMSLAKQGMYLGENNPNYGKKMSDETKRKLSIVKKGKRMGEDNHEWRGENVKISALHKWVRKYLSEPELCQICELRPPRDLANITGEYNRDFINWQYLCRFCHIWYDDKGNGRKRTTTYHGSGLQ